MKPQQQHTFALAAYSLETLQQLLEETVAEILLREQREKERNSLPEGHKPINVVINNIDPNVFWGAIDRRIRSCLKEAKVAIVNTYVDTTRDLRAIVRVELPSEVNGAVTALKKEFPAHDVFVPRPRKTNKKGGV